MSCVHTFQTHPFPNQSEGKGCERLGKVWRWGGGKRLNACNAASSQRTMLRLHSRRVRRDVTQHPTFTINWSSNLNKIRKKIGLFPVYFEVFTVTHLWCILPLRFLFSLRLHPTLTISHFFWKWLRMHPRREPSRMHQTREAKRSVVSCDVFIRTWALPAFIL